MSSRRPCAGSLGALARCIFGLPEAEGFALAGGAALLAHRTIERPTRDIDAFAGIRWAKELDAGVTNEAIASAFAHLNRLDDSELPTATPASTRSIYDQWRAELAGG